jgi:hypothetical protein
MRPFADSSGSYPQQKVLHRSYVAHRRPLRALLRYFTDCWIVSQRTTIDWLVMRLADQIDALQTWLAEHPRPAGVSVSEFLQSCATAGDSDARRILASGLYTSASADNDDCETLVAPAQVPPAVIDREHRLATQRVPTGKQTREPSRPIVHSGETRPWLTK